jgi:hypothetical protein
MRSHLDIILVLRPFLRPQPSLLAAAAVAVRATLAAALVGAVAAIPAAVRNI